MRISIIIPVYQVETYIEDCLNSVVSQTYQGEMECLLIDDCGTDNSIEIAERLIASYEGAIQFKIIHHERNRGLSAARNTGLQQATGDYIFFLDSDDTITTDCIEKMMSLVEASPDVELVQGNVETHPFKNIENLTFRVRLQKANTNEEARQCFFKYEQLNTNAWNKLIKRQFLIENSIWFDEGVLFEDTPWMFRLLKHLERACFVPEITYHYHRREDSIVTGTVNREKAENLRWIYHELLTNLTPNHEREEMAYYGKKFAYFCARFSREIPEFAHDLEEWQKYARMYNGWSLRIRLSIGRMMGGTRSGWLLMSLLYRIEHPRVIPSDIQRIWNKVKR